MNVNTRIHILRTFTTYLLVHIHHKKKIALEFAAKIASVNASLKVCNVLTHEYKLVVKDERK
jgi:hypothetical protein